MQRGLRRPQERDRLGRADEGEGGNGVYPGNLRVLAFAIKQQLIFPARRSFNCHLTDIASGLRRKQDDTSMARIEDLNRPGNYGDSQV